MAYTFSPTPRRRSRLNLAAPMRTLFGASLIVAGILSAVGHGG